MLASSITVRTRNLLWSLSGVRCKLTWHREDHLLHFTVRMTLFFPLYEGDLLLDHLQLFRGAAWRASVNTSVEVMDVFGQPASVSQGSRVVAADRGKWVMISCFSPAFSCFLPCRLVIQSTPYLGGRGSKPGA